MTATMTADQLAARTARAVAAAVGAGRERGLTVHEPVVLHDVFSVVVHLAPAPVVVRVPTVLPIGTDLDDITHRQRTELALVSWLNAQNVPVIAPSPLVATEPVHRDGFSMTFWQYVERDLTTEPDYVRNAALVADLHLALRDYPAELPFLSAAEPRTVTAGLDALTGCPELLPAADLERARMEWALLEPLASSRIAFDAEFPGTTLQPVHGDAPAYNIVATPTGPLYADFELVTLGPAEWDLAAFGPDAAAAYDTAAQGLGLRRLDARVLRFVEAIGMARTIACLPLVARQPILGPALAPAIDQWRTQPFAGGIFD
ncbi:aminoglycoside phosphotransferase family protein [Nocardia sp. NPDC059177]|uniref:aminoglycoside phosphotransferase family protein n=1 Tax=Nocardia sp. NPDC059177 TaxID=3346759 RepID=UPI003693F7E3